MQASFSYIVPGYTNRTFTSALADAMIAVIQSQAGGEKQMKNLEKITRITWMYASFSNHALPLLQLRPRSKAHL
jgi:hypothetical protein